MCMTFCCNPEINVTFCSAATHSCLGLKYLDTGYLVNATPLTVLARSFFKLCKCFCQGLKIYMTFCCNPQINFCHLCRSSDLVKAFRC